MKKSNVSKLLAIYDAIGGMISETPDPFDQFYEGGTDKLISDFESVLTDCGVKFAERTEGKYYIVSHMNFVGKEWEELNIKPKKEWGICTDRNAPNASWVLTGFASADDALKVIMDRNIFDDYDGKPVEVIDLVNAA